MRFLVNFEIKLNCFLLKLIKYCIVITNTRIYLCKYSRNVTIVDSTRKEREKNRKGTILNKHIKIEFLLFSSNFHIKRIFKINNKNFVSFF